MAGVKFTVFARGRKINGIKYLFIEIRTASDDGMIINIFRCII